MANTANFANALALALTLTHDEQALLVQTISALSHVDIAQVSAPIAQTAPQSTAPQRVRNTTPKECIDTDVHVELLGKGHVGFFTEGEDGKRNGVATRYMQCVKASLLKDELKLVWDGEFERAEVYKVDYTGKDGVFHAKGTHKHGAYRIERDGKVLSQQAVKAWADKHGIIAIGAADAKAVDDKRVERNIRKNEKSA